ncbi:MAG: hypothetical protein AAGD96_32070 [Chloroflexota bacterium]
MSMKSVFAQSSWENLPVVDTESFKIIDEGDGISNIELGFGDTLAETLLYNRTTSRFEFSSALHVNVNLSVSG